MVTPLPSLALLPDRGLGVEAERIDAAGLLGGLPVGGAQPQSVEPSPAAAPMASQEALSFGSGLVLKFFPNELLSSSRSPAVRNSRLR